MFFSYVYTARIALLYLINMLVYAPCTGAIIGSPRYDENFQTRSKAVTQGTKMKNEKPFSPAPWLVAMLFLACLANPAIASNPASDPSVWTEKNLPNLIQLYRHLHAHPELSYREKQTAARLASEFEAIGAKVTTNVGGHGVVALLEGGPGSSDGLTVMMRTDMDALPISEETGLAYASKVRTMGPDGNEVGVMHACGHDVHMTNLVGVARYLAAHKDIWRGTAMFVLQPAEEVGGGAKAMLSDGLFERFSKPDYALAMHVDPSLATGKIAYRPGYSFASVDTVAVTLNGRGGHGALPHTTIDPIVLAGKLVLDLQTIVSREIKPIEPAVITVGSLHCGTKANIIGDTCELRITVRSYSDRIRAHLLEAIERKAKAVAMGAGAPMPKIAISKGSPSLRNDEALAEHLLPVFHRVAGAGNVELAEPIMVGEDFSRYGRAGAPILMWWIGAVNPQRLANWKSRGLLPPDLHSSLFYPDAQETLQLSVVTMVSAALALFQP
uniref:Hippurate hydrolase n=1 Tax=Candidatus Kentrum sp. MB TaxID=2138164 RepID=A0A450Y0Y1_9GAMM|nr:MAG: hippurate hydrolase [Candidatus Kentron sp. MB]VFK77109.1 MAG: hippurate hydrolase [Candidatus Kentron sp. MB]